MMQTTIKVEGMTCQNCERAVKDALLSVSGVTEVSINLDNGQVTIDHLDNVDATTFKEVVEEQGYDVV